MAALDPRSLIVAGLTAIAILPSVTRGSDNALNGTATGSMALRHRAVLESGYSNVWCR
jgi:hypothetical protein